jgi:hypothetical protein
VGTKSRALTYATAVSSAPAVGALLNPVAGGSLDSSAQIASERAGQGRPLIFLRVHSNRPLHQDRTNGVNAATMGSLPGRVDLCHRSIGAARRDRGLDSLFDETSRFLPDPDADLHPSGQHLFRD